MAGVFQRHQAQVGNVGVQAFGQAGQQGHIVLPPQNQCGHVNAQGFWGNLQGGHPGVGSVCRAQGRCPVVVQTPLQAVLPDLAVLRFNFRRQPAGALTARIQYGRIGRGSERHPRCAMTGQKSKQLLKIIGRQLLGRLGLHQKAHVSAGGLLGRVRLQCLEESAGMRRIDDDQFSQAMGLLVGQVPGHSATPVVGHQGR